VRSIGLPATLSMTGRRATGRGCSSGSAWRRCSAFTSNGISRAADGSRSWPIRRRLPRRSRSSIPAAGSWRAGARLPGRSRAGLHVQARRGPARCLRPQGGLRRGRRESRRSTSSANFARALWLGAVEARVARRATVAGVAEGH